VVGTGLEYKSAKDSGAVVVSKKAGVVTKVSADRIVVQNDDGSKETYNLLKFIRSNQGTCYNQRPIVRTGDRIEAGEIIADGPSTDQGMALGRNVWVPLCPGNDYNYEDPYFIS
jgi:DNA-directed RNA polymerase subunit beta